tara:strand:+ start:1929 stop:2453 length:525 start_codon:yes stop_codon:yes gene_type:complete
MPTNLPDGVSEPMTKDSAVDLFNEDNPNDKYIRRSNLDSFYPLEEWIVRVLNGEVVGIQGFTDRGSYFLVGGAKGREGVTGTLKLFQKEREKWIGGKPKIAGLNAKRGSQEQYLDFFRNTGWSLNPDEFEGVPQKVIETWKKNYPDGNWGIKKRAFTWKEMLLKDEMYDRLGIC